MQTRGFMRTPAEAVETHAFRPRFPPPAPLAVACACPACPAATWPRCSHAMHLAHGGRQLVLARREGRALLEGAHEADGEGQHGHLHVTEADARQAAQHLQQALPRRGIAQLLVLRVEGERGAGRAVGGGGVEGRRVEAQLQPPRRRSTGHRSF